MKPEYKATATNLKPYEITPDDLLHVGRLVRSWAIVEDAVTLWIAKITGMDFVHMLLMLGRQPVSSRLVLAGELAKSQSPETVALHKRMFDNDTFHQVAKFRNAVAHGVIMGLTDDGQIAFRTQEKAKVDVDEYVITVIAWEPGFFRHYADLAEKIAKLLTDEPWHRKLAPKFAAQSLGLHPKAQAKARRGDKSRNPPRSSRS